VARLDSVAVVWITAYSLKKIWENHSTRKKKNTENGENHNGTKRNADSGVIYHPTDRMDYLGAVNPAPIFLSAAQLFLNHIHKFLEQSI